MKAVVTGWGTALPEAVVTNAQLEARLAALGVSCNLVTTVIQPYAQAL